MAQLHRASPKFSDGTGLKSAVAEISRPVTARAAISFPIRPKLVSACQNPGRSPSPSEERRKDIEHHRHSVISIQPRADDISHRTPICTPILFQLEQTGHTAPKSRTIHFKNEHRRFSFVICRRSQTELQFMRGCSPAI